MIYLAAPYTTGLPPDTDAVLAMETRAKQIARATARLMEEGLAVYSPVTHGTALEDHVSADNRDDHAFWMRHCFQMLDAASELVVLMLPGWRDSKGVQMEIDRAAERAIPIRLQPVQIPREAQP